jgi:predicted nuclease with RNAse H fold
MAEADGRPARAAEPWTLGIDLRSGPRYRTGLAVMDAGRRLRLLATVRDDDEIDAAVARWRPALVAIDAPLALPEGRCCADPACECARFGIMREVDRICAAAGYRPFPALLPSMVKLTLRGIALLGRLSAQGIATIEVYPGMAQDILGIPRKRLGVEALDRGLRRSGVRGLPRRAASHDELDAATCALVAQLHLEAETEVMGSGIPVPLVHPRRGSGG